MDIKKISIFLIAITLVIFLLVFSGCSNNQQADQQATQEQDAGNVDEDPEIGQPEGEADTDIEAEGEEESESQGEEEQSSGYNNDFTLLDLEGNEVSLSDFEGQIVVLNFWATWCNPCKLEIPDFIEVNDMYKDKGVQFLGISNDNVGSLESFVDEYGINYPTLIDGSIDSISKYWRISAIPTTYIVDGSGNAVFRQIGLMTKNQLVNAIEEQL